MNTRCSHHLQESNILLFLLSTPLLSKINQGNEKTSPSWLTGAWCPALPSALSPGFHLLSQELSFQGLPGRGEVRVNPCLCNMVLTLLGRKASLLSLTPPWFLINRKKYNLGQGGLEEVTLRTAGMYVWNSTTTDQAPLMNGRFHLLSCFKLGARKLPSLSSHEAELQKCWRSCLPSLFIKQSHCEEMGDKQRRQGRRHGMTRPTFPSCEASTVERAVAV